MSAPENDRPQPIGRPEWFEEQLEGLEGDTTPHHGLLWAVTVSAFLVAAAVVWAVVT